MSNNIAELVAPKALDLFCGAGGASMGLYRAGFEVMGVDLEWQPRYPFEFQCRDATDFPLDGFDLIWASPPCQAFTAYKRRHGHVNEALNFIPQIRERLRSSRSLYVIENVIGAPLLDPVMLCGSMFNLDVQRHRIFESNFPIVPLKCDHHKWTPRFAQATNRKNKRKTVEVGVYRIPLHVQRQAMGIEWMRLNELSQAVPPAYSNYIGKAAMAMINKRLRDE